MGGFDLDKITIIDPGDIKFEVDAACAKVRTVDERKFAEFRQEQSA